MSRRTHGGVIKTRVLQELVPAEDVTREEMETDTVEMVLETEVSIIEEAEVAEAAEHVEAEPLVRTFSFRENHGNMRRRRDRK